MGGNCCELMKIGLPPTTCPTLYLIKTVTYPSLLEVWEAEAPPPLLSFGIRFARKKRAAGRLAIKDASLINCLSRFNDDHDSPFDYSPLQWKSDCKERHDRGTG